MPLRVIQGKALLEVRQCLLEFAEMEQRRAECVVSLQKEIAILRALGELEHPLAEFTCRLERRPDEIEPAEAPQRTKEGGCLAEKAALFARHDEHLLNFRCR